MKIIKLVVISAVILFALVTAMSLLLPSHVRVSRAINISATRENIAPYINELGQWKKWNRFVIQADSMHTLESISGRLIEAGGLEIRLENHGIDTIETRWQQPGGKISQSKFVLLGEHFSVVQWYFDFHQEWYPWQKFQSIIYDKQLGPYMEGSLHNLKQVIETTK